MTRQWSASSPTPWREECIAPESDSVVEGCRMVNDLLDMVLVDPTIHTKSILTIHRRMFLAIKARKVPIPTDW